MDYKQFLLDHLDLVEQVVRFIARRHRLSAFEQDELGSIVHLKLLEDDCAILRKFQGRSSIRTYLTTVVQRLFLDYRIEQWGKWRPSAQGRRLGPTAVLLERLVTRDGMSGDQALEIARTNHRVEESVAQLRALLEALPSRTPRRWVSDDELADVPSDGPLPDALLTVAERSTKGMRMECALRAALRALPAQDQLILKLRFVDGRQIASIARALQLEQKPLYRRIEQIAGTLRAALVAQGLSRDDIESPGDVGPVMG